MTTLIYVVGILVLSSAILCAWLVATAPLGWEDDNGFHLGDPDD